MEHSIFTSPSTERVLLTKKPKIEKIGYMAKNEVFSFQLVYTYPKATKDITLSIDSDIKNYITVRRVDYVPATTPSLGGDDYVISKEPFLCPDVLRPLSRSGVVARYGVYNTLWLTVKGNLPVGRHKIKLSLSDQWNPTLSCEYTLNVLDFELVEADFTYTNWFHYDSIASYYRLDMFSKKYNKIMYNYIKCATEHGMNMLLVPMFTPPLDTRVGYYRRTAQLIDVYLNDGEYSFDFDRLIEFMKSVQALGIKYFEMSHLFTQWGAKATPKIMAKVNGRQKRIFGWDVSANDPRYEHFLSRLLPELEKRLTDEGLFEYCRFHISDEPNEHCVDSYKQAKQIFKKYMKNGIITDALSHYDFYKDGLVDMAICSTDAIKPFLENKVPNLWTYYCCAQGSNYLSNRFMQFFGERIRVIGPQLYLNDIKGFLQWGYNFYNTVLSDEEIDPYLITDGGSGFQSGDAFSVYPGKDGPYSSIRLENFYEGLLDMRLLLTLEGKVGKEKTKALLLENGFDYGFYTYPRSDKRLKEIRRMAQKMILKNS